MVLLQRLNTGIETLLRENQCGFRRNRSCIDQLYSLRCIIHNCLEYNVPLYINFIDFKAAFDSIKRDFIWKAFEHYGMPSKYIRIIQAFFNSTVSAVRVEGELTEWFDVKSGTGQGDIQGPPVFNVCLNLAAQLVEMNKVISQGALIQKGIPPDIPAISVTDLDYADDMAAMDNTKEGLQETTNLLAHYSAYSGLKINAKKTNVMAISKNADQRPYTEESTLDITIDGTAVEQVSDFTYLGSIISANGKIDRELTARIRKAAGAFNQLGSIWYNRNILNNTKVRIYKAAVVTILTYSCEVWSTTQAQMSRIEAFHQRCLRKILRIKWFHRVKNVDVLTRAQTISVETHIAAMRLRWFGHVTRMPGDRLPRYLLGWVPEHGKRSRGRPRKTWMDCVKGDYSSFTGNVDNDINMEIMRLAADNRKQWRSMIVNSRDTLKSSGHST